MGLVRQLQHWLGGRGPRLTVAEFVPDDHPLRRWADTLPWASMVAAWELDRTTLKYITQASSERERASRCRFLEHLSNRYRRTNCHGSLSWR